MPDLGVFTYPGALVPGDPQHWRFFNRYEGEEASADPLILETRKEANDLAKINLTQFGIRRIGIVIIKGGARG
jgi:hypothetical protein